MNNGQPMQVADLVQQQFPGDRSLLNAAPGQQLDLADLRPAEQQIGEDFNWLMEWSPLLRLCNPPTVVFHDFISNHPCAECENDPARMRCRGDCVLLQPGSLNRRWLCAAHAEEQDCVKLSAYRRQVGAHVDTFRRSVRNIHGDGHAVPAPQQPVARQPQPASVLLVRRIGHENALGAPLDRDINNGYEVDEDGDERMGFQEDDDDNAEEEGDEDDEDDDDDDDHDADDDRASRRRRRRRRRRHRKKRHRSRTRSPPARKRSKNDNKRLWRDVRTHLIEHQKRHLADLALELITRDGLDRVSFADVCHECQDYPRETFDEIKQEFYDKVGNSTAEEVFCAISKRETLIVRGQLGAGDEAVRKQCSDRMRSITPGWLRDNNFPLRIVRKKFFERIGEHESDDDNDDDDCSDDDDYQPSQQL